MPTESLVCASGPRPDTMIMAESGTAPSSGRTMPPREKDYIHPLGFHTFLKILDSTFREWNTSSQYSTTHFFELISLESQQKC